METRSFTSRASLSSLAARRCADWLHCAGALIGLRGIQAIGAAMLFSNAPAILTKTFPPQQRGRALGALGTFTYLGLTVGPSLGGWLSGTFGWRSVFYINVPVARCVALALWFIAHDRPEGKKEQFDFKGALLFMPGLVALLAALNEGHAMGWMDARIIGMFLVSVSHVRVRSSTSSCTRSPMLDLSLFSVFVFSSTTLSALLNYCSVFSVLVRVAFLLIQGRGLTAQHAGSDSNRSADSDGDYGAAERSTVRPIGSRIPATVGMAILTAGILLLAAQSR